MSRLILPFPKRRIACGAPTAAGGKCKRMATHGDRCGLHAPGGPSRKGRVDPAEGSWQSGAWARTILPAELRLVEAIKADILSLEAEITILKLQFWRCAVAEKEYHGHRLAIEEELKVEEEELTRRVATHYPVSETSTETEAGQEKRKRKRTRIDYADRMIRLSSKIAQLVTVAAQIRHLAAVPPGDVQTLEEIAGLLDSVPIMRKNNGRF